MPPLPPRIPALTPLLVLLLAVQVGGFAYTVWFFVQEGYLPAPFVYDKSDTFMDFFHPLYWAGDDGRYTVWKSVYPPLNFLILKLVAFPFLNGENFSDGFAIRAAHPELQWVVVILALGSAALAFVLGPTRQWPARDQILLFLFFVLSPPFLFGVERGNLIVLALPLLAIVLTRTGVARLLAIAVLINIKPYFVLLSLVYVLRRHFDWAILTWLSAALIFLVTGLLTDADFPVFFENLFGFSQSETVFSGREVLALPSSIGAFAYVASMILKTGDILVSFPYLVELIALSGVANLGLIAVCCFGLAVVGPYVPASLLLAFILVLITNLGVWVGGYSLMFTIFVLPLVCLSGWSLSIASIIIITFFMPLELLAIHSAPIGQQNVFLSNQTVPVVFDMTVGLIRPWLNVALLCLITFHLWTTYRSHRESRVRLFDNASKAF